MRQKRLYILLSIASLLAIGLLVVVLQFSPLKDYQLASQKYEDISVSYRDYKPHPMKGIKDKHVDPTSIALGYHIIPQPKEVDPYKDERTEWVSLYLYKKLENGEHQYLEEYFTKQHDAFSVNGFTMLTTIYESWFRDDMAMLGANPQGYELIKAWQQAYPDSVFATLLEAEYFVEQAWNSRGYQTVQYVTDDGWKGFYKNLYKANDLVDEAYTLNPLVDLTYTLKIEIIALLPSQTPDYNNALTRIVSRLLSLSAGILSKRQISRVHAMEAIVEQAKRHGVESTYAMHKTIHWFGYTPQWGGTERAVLQYARDLVKKYPDDALFSRLVIAAHKYLADYHQQLSKRMTTEEYYAQPSVWEEIERHMDRVIHQYPNSTAAMRDYVEMIVDAQKWHLFPKAFSRLMVEDRTYSDLYFIGASEYIRDDKTMSYALHMMKQYQEFRPEDPEAYVKLAYGAKRTKQYEQAIEYANQAIAKGHKGCYSRAYICDSYRELGKLDKALEVCSQAARKYPYCSIVYHYRGKVHEALGNTQEAKRDQRQYQSKR